MKHLSKSVTGCGSIVEEEAMGEGIVRLLGVAECAFVDNADMPLLDQRLIVVRLGDRGREGVRAVVAGHAHDAAVPTRLTE